MRGVAEMAIVLALFSNFQTRFFKKFYSMSKYQKTFSLKVTEQERDHAFLIEAMQKNC
jgi:hypothetical protein